MQRREEQEQLSISVIITSLFQFGFSRTVNVNDVQVGQK